MCGRASQYSEFSEIEKRFRLTPGRRPNVYTPHWNAAPRMDLLVVRHDDVGGGRVADCMRWGLVPSWSKDAGIGDKAINARSETVTDKPMFRGAWRAGRRLLIPLNSFFEWRTVGKGKQPFAFGLVGGEMMGVGGLWESWRRPDGAEMRTFTVLTVAANSTVAAVHGRMPVIVAEEDFEAWLRGSSEVANGLLRPYRGPMRSWAVSRAVNRVGGEDGPECLDPASPTPGST